MGDALRYKGNILTWIHSYTGENRTQFNLIMEGVGALEQLCRLSDEEILEVDGMNPMTYREFKEQIASRTRRIYLSDHEYNLDFHSSRNSE